MEPEYWLEDLYGSLVVVCDSVVIHHPSYMLIQFLFLNSGIFFGTFSCPSTFHLISPSLSGLSDRTSGSMFVFLTYLSGQDTGGLRPFDHFLMEEMQKDML